MKYAFLIIASLISITVYAQKKPAKKVPPPIVAIPIEVSKPEAKNPFTEQISFSWKNQPDLPTTFTPKDVLQKKYTFINEGRNVRVSTVYPQRDMPYKKLKKGELEIAQAQTIHYKDYQHVDVSGTKVKLTSDDGKEVVHLQLIKKGDKLVQLKEEATGKFFNVTER